MTDDTPRRDDRITRTVSFRLLRAVNRMTRPFHETFGRRFGVTLPQWRCLMALAAGPDRSGEDVAEAMGMDRMTISRTLRALEAAGRAERRADPHHARRNLWRLTADGWAIADAVIPEALARDGTLFGQLDREDWAALDRILGKLEG